MSKMLTPFRTLGFSATIAAVLLLGLGCSLHRARKALDEGRYDEAVQAYQSVLQTSPNNITAKIGYRRAASLAAEVHLTRAHAAQKHGLDDQVYLEVRKAVVLDPANAVAQDWIVNLEMAIQKKKLQQEAEESIDAQRIKADMQPAMLLNPRSLEGMDLNFARKTSLKEIFAALSKNSGVNIILHNSFQDSQISVDLRGLTFQRILDTLMLQNDLFYKTLDTNTIMVVKSSQQTKEQFENQLIKTFYLSNADPNDVRSIFQQIMPTLKVFTDKRLNAVTIKAKPQELTIARRVVSQLDKANAEVMVYLELLEVSEKSTEAVGLMPTADGTNGMYRLGATIDGLGNINQNKGGIKISRSDIRFLFPSLALDALKSSGEAKLVASPNVRVISGGKGEVNIGDKVSQTQSSISIPGFSGTGSTGTTGTGVGGYGGIPQTQYSYEEAGVKITVEPRVHFNDDITVKIKSEVKTLIPTSDPNRNNFGQRIIETQARLRNGETAVFAGLLKEDDQKSHQGVWGISDIPILGKLLGNHHNQATKTDVLLTIRAVVVRKPDIQAEDWEAFDPDLATSKAGPFSGKAESNPVVKPAAAANPVPVPAPPTKPADTANTPATPPPPPPAGDPKPKPDEAAPVPADSEEGGLVLFLAPVFTPLNKGDRVQLNLLVSNGKGLTSGSMDIRIDPKLKFQSIVAGDFLTAEAGTMQQTLGKDGTLKISFTRKGSDSDSGTLAILELEGLAPGNAPVLVQGGKYMLGTNPVSARVVNSLVTVE